MRKHGPKRPIHHHTEPSVVVDRFYTVRRRGEDALWSGLREERAYEVAAAEADKAGSFVELLAVARVHLSKTSPRSDRIEWIQDVHPFAEVMLQPASRPRPSALAERAA